MGIFFSVFPGGQHLGRDAGFDPKAGGEDALVKIRERRRLESFESRLSVRPCHETGMVDNHYKTSLRIK